MSATATIFLSYARADHLAARRFAEGLEAQGFTVWWDATLHTGEFFDQVIERRLNEAKAVVVLWSKKSVDSRWVRAEATIADRNKTLAPVLIEACQRPIIHELTHTADLSHWTGNSQDPAWQAFVADVWRLTKKDGPQEGTAADRPPLGPKSTTLAPVNRRGFRVAAIILGIVGLLVITAAVQWLLVRGSIDRSAPPAAAAISAPLSVTTPAAKSSAPAASIAVVPFANLTGEPAKEYFSDGMAEELINVLSKVPGLEVASRTSSFAYKGKNSDIRQIARDLDVATILEGSVRSAGARIRVTAELVNAGSGYHIWSESYDRNYGDLFKLEDELAGEIVAAFKKSQGVDLPAYESQGPPTADLEAYRLYLQGKAAFSLDTDPGAHEAIELTEQAVARDPKFARAWILMADARDYLSSSPLAEIERDARQAIALDPSAGDGGLLGLVESRRGHWVAAEEQFRGRTANSKDPWLHARYAFATLWPGGHIQSMLQQLLQAYHLSPATATFSGDLQVAFANMDRDAEALRYAKINVAAGADPSNAKIKQTYIDDLVQARRYSEAADMAIALLSEDQRARGTAEQIKLYYAAVEDPAKRPAAVSALKHLVPGFGHDDWRSRVGAMIQFTILGDLDSAYGLGDQLRALFAKQGPLAAWSWLWSPPMHPFRADQRFQGFATRLGLMDYWNKYGPPDDCNLKEHKLTCH